MSDDTPTPEQAETAVPEPTRVTVTRGYKAHGGLYLIRYGREVRLLPEAGWESPTRQQEIEEGAFKALDKPHDFGRRLPMNGEAAAQVNQALWSHGVFRPDQVRDTDIERATRAVGRLIAETLKPEEG